MKDKEGIFKLVYVFLMAVILCFIIIKAGNAIMDIALQPKPQPQIEYVGIITSKNPEIDQNELECLKQALWFESRGEGQSGIEAVATVILNRVKSRQYPDTFCEVIHQHKQFSYVHERQQRGQSLEIRVRPSEEQAYNVVSQVAENVIAGDFNPVLPSSVLWYATTSVNNYWTRVKTRVEVIGNHVFYAQPSKDRRN